MIKKILLSTLLIILLIGAFLAWAIFGSGTSFSGKKYELYIPTGANFDEVLSTLDRDHVLKNASVFKWLAGRMEIPQKLKAGKYEIESGTSILQLTRMLHNGRQTPVNMVITKLRTKEDFARFAGKQLECDSAAILSYLDNTDSLKKYGLDSNTALTAVIPNTYTMYWNTTAPRLYKRLYGESQKFWTDERKQKASKLGLSETEVYTLASILEEETNKYDEMPTMASVYINRLRKGMRLSADPTVKYALRNFSIKRITFNHINSVAESPFNTYRHEGLPPGPICIPSQKTIDATLDALSTDYLFFCAKPDFSGYHNFTGDEQEHFKNAKAYQRALDSLMIK